MGWLKLLATKASDLTRVRPEHFDRVLDRANDNERAHWSRGGG